MICSSCKQPLPDPRAPKCCGHPMFIKKVSFSGLEDEAFGFVDYICLARCGQTLTQFQTRFQWEHPEGFEHWWWNHKARRA